MKTSELTGIALDWAADMAEGRIRPDGGYYCGHHGKVTKWSADWSQGGPIIEREKINIWWHPGREHWIAQITGGPIIYAADKPASPLTAAMRCYVASKLGDDVEIPEELK